MSAWVGFLGGIGLSPVMDGEVSCNANSGRFRLASTD
jgi:hypothetical protein